MSENAPLRKFKPELSYMNIFCALLVIFIHCASVPLGELPFGERAFNLVFVPWRFSSFVVPAFIFMSGVKLFQTDRKINYFKFYLGRLKRVVLPYMLWVIIYLFFFINHDYFDFSWELLIHSWLRGDLVGHFYFVIIIVQFYLLMPLWRFALRRINPAPAIAFSALVSIVFGFNLLNMLNVIVPGYEFEWSDVIFTKYLFYWVCGCYAGMNYKSFKAGVLKNKLLITLLFLIFASLDIFLAHRTYSTTAGWMESVHIMYCVCAILFFFMLFCIIAGSREKLFIITKALDAESYNIYLSHCLIILWLNDYMITVMNIDDVLIRFKYVTLAAYIGSAAFWLLWWFIKLFAGKLWGYTGMRLRRK
ncbi:MAG TPA: acyltransferase [Candidatus Monoglobus merdigallinarum]|uniref:Acyltransferase n=1 Tax=Candidatus Monoglobus merdigallinarum TaxID=2838698 RepID=A0A9D1PPU7_9FIRM|nr:acyltransferase [Candidatus Monoglobus merdigallinarum]